MGLSRRASMAYGRAASGIQLSTHVSGGGLSAGWEEEEVERGEAGEKWLGSRILAYSESGEKADGDAGCGHRRRLMRWRQWAGGLGSEGGLERRDESGGRGRGERRARRRSSAAAARSSAMGVCPPSLLRWQWQGATGTAAAASTRQGGKGKGKAREDPAHGLPFHPSGPLLCPVCSKYYYGLV